MAIAPPAACSAMRQATVYIQAKVLHLTMFVDSYPSQQIPTVWDDEGTGCP